MGVHPGQPFSVAEKTQTCPDSKEFLVGVEDRKVFLQKRRLGRCVRNQTKRIQVYSVLDVEPMTHWGVLELP